VLSELRVLERGIEVSVCVFFCCLVGLTWIGVRVRNSFKKVHLNKPTWCDYCGDFIFGLGYQGFRCTSCRFVVHKKTCIAVAQTTRCSGKVVDTEK
jgi:Phorbol esters/diacylglycerol binding domain (C1 domain)